MSRIMDSDLDRIKAGLTSEEKGKLADSVVLLTGCAGFLGFYFLHFFTRFKEELSIREVIGLDNFKTGYPPWLKPLQESGKIKLYPFDIIKDRIESVEAAGRATHIYHMASIASPTYYRRYPIETLDANVWGLRNLLEYYKDKPIKGFAFFSSSEIYGDPDPAHIPTSEEYRGYVSSIGPRACYDEAKRFGETLCYLFARQYRMPITMIRPFNNYGPGMRLNDSRVPADFAKAVRENRDLEILSDGTPRRTFCYISDAITGYLKVLLHEGFEVFNIGMDQPEVSILQLARIYQEAGREIFGYTGQIRYEKSSDKAYLTDNPNRRCPNIQKARRMLGYQPQIAVQEGVRYFLEYIRESKEELEW